MADTNTPAVAPAADPVVVPAVVPATPTTSALESAKEDIAKIEEAIKNLEAIPGEICATELVILRQKRDTLIAMVKAEVEELAAAAGKIEQSFAQRYGVAAAHAIEIACLAAILCKLFGVI